MSVSDELQVEIRQIEPGDTFTGLSFGHAEFEPLKRFIRKQALAFHQDDLAKTYGVFLPDDKLVAYITLVCGQIEVGQQINASLAGEADYNYDHCPAVKIARLAVDRRQQGRRIGLSLVNFALGLVKDEISPRIGCRFVVVDAKKSAVSFYEKKCGFTLLDTEGNRDRDCPILFVDLRKTTGVPSEQDGQVPAPPLAPQGEAAPSVSA